MLNRGMQDEGRGLSPTAPLDRAPRPVLVAAVLVARGMLSVAVLLWLAALTPALLGMRLTTVMSDSMAPALVAGDAVVIRPIAASQAHVGDVLLVDDPDRPGRLRLHRLVEESAGRLVLRGDANRAADSSSIAPEHVRGAAALRIPFAGLPDLWWRTGDVVPLALFAVVLSGLGLLACADIRPPPDDLRRRPRRADPTRLLPFGRRRVVGVRGVVLVAALLAPLLATGHGVAGWSIFSGIITSSTNTIGANSTFTNCPARPGGLPTPSLYYAYTAASGTSEPDLQGSNSATLTGTTRTAGYCDGTAPSPYLTLTDSTSAVVVTTGTKITSPSTAFSISLWINPANAGTGILADFTDSNGGGSQTMTDRQIYYKTDGSLAFGARFGSGTGTPVTCSATAPSSGTWHHLVGTGTAAGVLTLYVDGAQACTTTGSGYAPSGAAGGGFWSFGAERPVTASAWGESSTSTGFVGGFDETTLYNSAITATDVANLYAAGH
jgi:hypothetical protein